MRSDNLQYNTLVCLANGTNHSSTKHLTFQVLFFIIPDRLNLRALKKIILGTSDAQSFVPSAQQTSVLYCKLTDFKCYILYLARHKVDGFFVTQVTMLLTPYSKINRSKPKISQNLWLLFNITLMSFLKELFENISHLNFQNLHSLILLLIGEQSKNSITIIFLI